MWVQVRRCTVSSSLYLINFLDRRFGDTRTYQRGATGERLLVKLGRGQMGDMRGRSDVSTIAT